MNKLQTTTIFLLFISSIVFLGSSSRCNTLDNFSEKKISNHCLSPKTSLSAKAPSSGNSEQEHPVKYFPYNPTEGSFNQDQMGYVGSPPAPFKEVIDREAILESDDVFLDVGCGRGYFLEYLASTFSIKKFIGVEFISKYAEQAFDMVSKSSTRKTPVDIYNLDMADERCLEFLDEITVVYLYHPFEERTYKALFYYLQLSLKRKPRKIKIISLNSSRSYPYERWHIGEKHRFFNTPNSPGTVAYNYWELTNAEQIKVSNFDHCLKSI